MTDPEQTKACAELDDKPIIGYRGDRPYIGTGGGTVVQYLPDYLSSHDAIFPLIIKYCGDDRKRWKRFSLFLGSEFKISYVSYYTSLIRAMVKATPEQLVKALLQTAERWVD